MALPKHFRIDYLLNGAFKSFYIRAEQMDAAQAWQHASIDAGLVRIPRFRMAKTAAVSRPNAEQYGISNVEWAQA
jgi:hypothetical protein